MVEREVVHIKTIHSSTLSTYSGDQSGVCEDETNLSEDSSGLSISVINGPLKVSPVKVRPLTQLY